MLRELDDVLRFVPLLFEHLPCPFDLFFLLCHPNFEIASFLLVCSWRKLVGLVHLLQELLLSLLFKLDRILPHSEHLWVILRVEGLKGVLFLELLERVPLKQGLLVRA